MIDVRAWGVAAFLALLLGGAVFSGRQIIAAKDKAHTEEVAGLKRERTDLSDKLKVANAARADAEGKLSAYAQDSLTAFKGQVEASRATAQQLAEINRRASAANKEIDRAPAGLRLDDPMPRGLRDALACSGGDNAACAASADPGGLPAGAADPGPKAGGGPAATDHSGGASHGR